MAYPDHRTTVLQTAIAAELRRVRLELERVAEVLVGDEHFVTTYLDQLQIFDFIGQCADETASLIERLSAGDDPEAAVSRVRLDVMVHRLRTAMECDSQATQIQAVQSRAA